MSKAHYYSYGTAGLTAWQSTASKHQKKVCITHFASTLSQFDTCRQTHLKLLCRWFQKLRIFFAPLFLSFFFPFFLFLFFLSILHSLSANLQIMSSLKKPSLNVSSFTMIPFNGDLHRLRDHPSLFCMLRFSMAVFLSISEQKKLTRLFSPLLCVIIWLKQPYLETPIMPLFAQLKQPDIPSHLPLPPVESHVSQPNTQLSEWAAHQQIRCLPRATKQQNISHISRGALDPILPLNSVTSSRQTGTRETSMLGAHTGTDALSDPVKPHVCLRAEQHT